MLDLTPSLIGAFITGAVMVGLIVATYYHHDVEARTKAEMDRLNSVKETQDELNKYLAGSVMVNSFDARLEHLSRSQLIFIREIIYDIDLARRMKEGDSINEKR